MWVAEKLGSSQNGEGGRDSSATFVWLGFASWIVAYLVTATFSKQLQVSTVHGRLDIADYVLTEPRISIFYKKALSQPYLLGEDKQLHGKLYIVYS